MTFSRLDSGPISKDWSASLHLKLRFFCSFTMKISDNMSPHFFIVCKFIYLRIASLILFDYPLSCNLNISNDTPLMVNLNTVKSRHWITSKRRHKQKSVCFFEKTVFLPMYHFIFIHWMKVFPNSPASIKKEYGSASSLRKANTFNGLKKQVFVVLN